MTVFDSMAFLDDMGQFCSDYNDMTFMSYESCEDLEMDSFMYEQIKSDIETYNIATICCLDGIASCGLNAGLQTPGPTPGTITTRVNTTTPTPGPTSMANNSGSGISFCKNIDSYEPTWLLNYRCHLKTGSGSLYVHPLGT